MTDKIKQEVLEKLAKAMKIKSWKEIQIIPKWKTEIEKAINLTIQLKDEQFVKDLEELIKDMTSKKSQEELNKIIKPFMEKAIQLKSQEIIKDVQEYLDAVDNYIAVFLYAHGIKLDKFAEIWEKIKKKHLEELDD